jgi:error-prone DNA polymerase
MTSVSARRWSILFMTLEDDTGNTNVWYLGHFETTSLFNRQWLKINGIVEREGKVIHVIAGKLTNITPLLAEFKANKSRDFH